MIKSKLQENLTGLVRQPPKTKRKLSTDRTGNILDEMCFSVISMYVYTSLSMYIYIYILINILGYRTPLQRRTWGPHPSWAWPLCQLPLICTGTGHTENCCQFLWPHREMGPRPNSPHRFHVFRDLATWGPHPSWAWPLWQMPLICCQF